MRQPTPENEVIGCGGKYSWGALATLAHWQAEKCFSPAHVGRKNDFILFRRPAAKLYEVF